MSRGFYIAFFNIILCTFFSYIIGPLVKRIGEKYSIIDIPDLRKIHTYPIVRIGGISIFTTFFVSFCGINFGNLNFTLPFFGDINLILPQFLNYIITSFWIVGITNSINWLDGIDALAAGYSSILSIGLCILMILS